MSKHWHDLARLENAGIASSALADRAFALPVARHKAIFFSGKDAYGKRIDYVAISGGLQLVPSGAARAVLEGDYAKMMADGMLLEANEPFDSLMQRSAAIEARVNDSTA